MLTALLLAATVPPPPPPPGDRPLMLWTAGEMRCAGQPVTPTLLRRPSIQLGWSMTQPRPTTTLRLRFAVNDEGRATGIAREGTGYSGFDDGDVAPALAASRFAAGKPQAECSVVYTPRLMPMAEATVEDLVSYSIDAQSGPLPKAGWDRIAMPGSCAEAPRPAPLLRGYPDFLAVPGTPGARQWSLVGYDTDASGKPVKARVLHGTGDRSLDEASLVAVKASRFTQGARTGCQYPYSRGPVKLPAPPIPDKDYRPAAATCPAEHGWATPPQLTFPPPYQRRSIEGWAVIAYDVAPWGEPGNVRVLASEPAEAFGTQAMMVIRTARLAPSESGHTGCVDRVRFVMGPEGGVPTESSPVVPTVY